MPDVLCVRRAVAFAFVIASHSKALARVIDAPINPNDVARFSRLLRWNVMLATRGAIFLQACRPLSPI